MRHEHARSVLSALTIGIGAQVASSAQVLTFTGLTNPFPGGVIAHCTGVSADGSVVVGYSYKSTFPDFGDRSFRWIRGTGFDNPGPSQGTVLSYAGGVSAAGTVVAGNTGHAQFGDQEAWVRVGASRGHVGSPPGSDFSSLFGVSANGSICTGFGGTQSDPNSARAAIYNTTTDQWLNLGFLPGGVWSKALARSGNGSIVVGGSTSALTYGASAFVWTAQAGMQTVGPGRLPSGENAFAVGVSSDGSVIVGTDDVRDENYNSSTHTWRWTAADGMADLGAYIATGVSPDGRVVIGTSLASGTTQPVIWDAGHGWRDLHQLLVARGLDPALEGWTMDTAEAISQNGETYAIAGDGGDPAGYIAGWVVTFDHLDAPCPVIVQDPSSLTACGASGIGFSVSAFSDQEITYQWRHGAEALPGENGPTLFLPYTATTSAGSYDCILTTPCGSVVSSAAQLAVCASDLDCNGGTDTFDLGALLSRFGTTAFPGDPPDLNGDGVVNSLDLGAMLSGFGTACP